MKSIKLATAYDLLLQSPAVILEGRPLEPLFLGITGEPDNEFLHLRWEENELLFEVIFKEDDNTEVEVSGHTLTLIGIDGEEEELELLKEFNVEELI